ncbi:MAG: hypothetical protein HYX28_02210 [Candidatus Koribacter versatilis]|uniref:Uncharacterized protein n=1 Tax=Candidatus Korobacter versatilis TaxID=658062 RepID=A0A932ENR2_9BACT|nr:hypothetical protein [Candidatus Koribacter versatilis]
MQKKFANIAFALVLAALPAAAGAASPRATKAARPGAGSQVARKQAKQKFVLDVVRMAVALPQPDPQDRLRVLNSATGVIGPMNSAMARQFTTEGARLEAELIAGGGRPAVSIFSAGSVDCAVAAQFMDMVPQDAVARAEDSLLAALSVCPNTTREPLRRKLEAALENGIVSARPLLALMETSGPSSRWSQETFTKMFSALPKGAEQLAEAPNYAAMLIQMAPAVEKDVAKDAGVRFLEWLGQFGQGSQRNLAVNMAMGVLRDTLGEAKLREALASNVVAQSVAGTEGQPGEIEHPEEESVSVLEAMGAKGDQSERLRGLPASLRAREAAAHGFATGTRGDRKLADRYFDMAYSALDEVWSGRTPEKNVPAVVEEVSEAAAQVDAVAALQRAQRLTEPSAQAISMLAVARVVVGSQN